MVDLLLSYDEGKKMIAKKMNFDETELCLGLPGGNCYGKRGYEETVNLKLDLSTVEEIKPQKSPLSCPSRGIKSPAKTQAVGWPPVRAFRKNIATVQKSGDSEDASEKDSACGGGGAFVKVSMDGAPYLRKIDLQMNSTYQELSDALSKMFSSFTIGKCDTEGMMDFMNESKLMDLLNSSDYVPTYEDKDGDWMLVGDVPWEMFVESCKRLHIMKRN